MSAHKDINDAATVYEYYVDDNLCCFRYPDPITRNGGKTFSGVAVAWLKESPENTFTVPFHVSGEEMDQTHAKILEGICRKLKGE